MKTKRGRGIHRAREEGGRREDLPLPAVNGTLFIGPALGGGKDKIISGRMTLEKRKSTRKQERGKKKERSSSSSRTFSGTKPSHSPKGGT